MSENKLNSMLTYATRFTFVVGTGLSEVISLERMTHTPPFYWAIYLGDNGFMRSRWSEQFQVFRYKDDDESYEKYNNDTKYELEDAFNLIMSSNLYEKHKEYIRGIKK
jgi:hypothetical protein